MTGGGGDGAKIARENGIIKGRGLRQGMPVSPLISNLLLRDFDRTLVKHKISILRYADDLALFAASRSECESALAFIQNQLTKVKLNIPELSETSKTAIRAPSDAVTFLGIEIRRFGDKYELRAPDKKLESIVEKIMSLASFRNCLEDKRNIGHLSQVLDRFIIGHRASMAILDDPESFINRLEAAKKKAVKQLLQEIIGAKALANLDADKLAVLGVDQFPSNRHGLR
ncbi:reverse transcriptase domain-containing protein [Labrys sp. La1]|uniref:reverse transcriptase domain-containing protein n=1 Tax=Labrys sp. La1 TaxID=3404917 RepID=UPI003EBBF019